jgi:hypothetical protein
MVVLRCTQKLLVRLKRAGDLPAVKSTTRLGDWYGNILRIGRRQHLLFISERSRLSVVLPIAEAKRLSDLFPDAVCERLAIVGVTAADIADERVRMFGPLIYKLIDEVTRLDNPPLLVFGARMNVFERQLKAIEGRADARIFELGDLSNNEITSLLAVLEQHAQLGRLAAMSPGQRLDEFRVRAKKQILVAMREATQGYGFDEIVRDEFTQLDSRETRILFLCAAVATAELIDLSREQLLACAEEGPAEALVTVRRNLRGLLIEDEAGRMPARHRAFAGQTQTVLGEVGISAFLAHEDLEVSDEWRDCLLRELAQCQLFVPLLSKHYLLSTWAQQESGFIVSRLQEVVVAPLSLDGTRSGGFLSHLQTSALAKIDPLLLARNGPD